MRNPWQLYDELIAGVPTGIGVRSYYLGDHWNYLEAECGVGVSRMVDGGAFARDGRDACTLELHEVAQWVKSWNFEEASLGLAALNAWYTQPERLAENGLDIATGAGLGENPFHSMRERYAGKKVVVVGHFPNVKGMAEISDLTVLERDCQSPLDTPDPACEYLMSEQDYAFITGITLTNKTAPRLFELCADVPVILTGPSAVAAPVLFERGVDVIAGSVVVDAETAMQALRLGSHDLWRAGIKKFTWNRPDGVYA